jgi:glyoxylase-like metal-dependent hydrolase (beta-lactamase superfamily II)
VAPGPQGFIAPPLNPTGVRLETKELARGVYGLLSSKPPVDNSGFVLGEHSVLVVDAHINGAMAGMIQTAVRQITNKPILYVVNTNYHGDYTFGTTSSPGDIDRSPAGARRIAASFCSKKTMQDFLDQSLLAYIVKPFTEKVLPMLPD